MKKTIYFVLLLSILPLFLFSQNEKSDTTKNINIEQVVITANRLPLLLKNNPGSVTLVTPEMLSTMPKTIGVEEALRFVPGVRVDNQHDGERVHVSIRGQGILTESGLRGVGVIIDGIPVNDPSGFAPDLYDVDWSTVSKIEVLRGPAASLYGGGSAAGVLNITTQNGGPKPVGGKVSQTLGSNGFSKSLLQLDGTKNKVNYRISYSRDKGDGYRDHQAFWSNKIYEKLNFNPTKKLSLTQIISVTDYFQQNPEGLNLQQFDNLRQANPDARPFNEYQKTNRITIGFHGSYQLTKSQELLASSYLRSWNYKETSNKSAEHRAIKNPGASLQYNLHFTSGKLMHQFSVGADAKWQNINMYELESAANPNRVESIDETNLETNTLLDNQIISQQNTGWFALYHLGIRKLNFLGNLRYDVMKNELTDKMDAGATKTSKNFSQVSARIGANYDFTEAVKLFANWSQGFLPPSTEELASNPTGYAGFNTHLVPSTSESYETGIRGFIGKRIEYELTTFIMNTKNDFFRFKQSGRGNQEVFYGNAGNSKRKGFEAFISARLLNNLTWQLAYTFADYKYTSASVDPVYTDPQYVLTTPPAPGQYLPNSPKNQLNTELEYTFTKNLRVNVGTEWQSKWAIYTDAKAYNNELDPTIYQNWQDGFNLYNAGISYLWNLGGLSGECNLSARNLGGTTYMAFTEPDPDGNAYQPGPGREIFVRIKVRF